MCHFPRKNIKSIFLDDAQRSYDASSLNPGYFFCLYVGCQPFQLFQEISFVGLFCIVKACQGHVRVMSVPQQLLSVAQQLLRSCLAVTWELLSSCLAVAQQLLSSWIVFCVVLRLKGFSVLLVCNLLSDLHKFFSVLRVRNYQPRLVEIFIEIHLLRQFLIRPI